MKKILKCVISMILAACVIMPVPTVAKTLREGLDENLWINQTEQEKEDVFKYAGSDIFWTMYNRLRYEYVQASFTVPEGAIHVNGFFPEKEKAYKICYLEPSAFRVDKAYYGLYDCLHYAQNNEMESLFSDIKSYEVPVVSYVKYIAPMFCTFGTNQTRDGIRENAYTWNYSSATTDTVDLTDAIMTLTNVDGIDDVECVKIVRQEPITFIYIKSDSKEYALPFSTGTQKLYTSGAPGYGFPYHFTFEKNKLYTVEEMYKSMIEQMEPQLQEIYRLFEKSAIYEGIKLEPDKLSLVKQESQKPNGKVLATAGEMAEKLQAVGLMKGSDAGLKVQSGLTRAEGLTMLLRMTGQETKANSTTLKNKFEDMDDSHWANKMVAYAYDKGLVQGTSETEFSPEDNLSAAQFMVMLLRVMGYNELDGETLSLDNAKAFGEKVGFKTDFADVKNLKRGQMAIIASRALNTTCKDGKTVAEKLKDSGVLTQEQYETVSSPDFYFVPFE